MFLILKSILWEGLMEATILIAYINTANFQIRIGNLKICISQEPHLESFTKMLFSSSEGIKTGLI